MPSPLLRNPIADVANALDALAIPHVFTGSVALAAHRKLPLGTKDVNVVVYGRGRRVALAQALNHLAGAGVEVDPIAALRALDEVEQVAIAMPVGPVREGEAPLTFAAELLLPKLPALDGAVLARAVTVPYPDRPQGVKVVTLEDWALFKLVFFRERDRTAVTDVLRATPGLDVGYVRRSLELVFPPGSERLTWLEAAAARSTAG